jgi:carboxyl-terminal processing protease
MKILKVATVAAVSAFVGFASALSFSQIEIKPLKIDDSKVGTNQKEFLNDIINRVKKDYVEEKTDRQLAEAAASGILSSLDPHSSYLNEDALKEMQVQTKGEFGGLGIEITTEMSVVKVVTPIDDTPAAKAEIKAGDYITRVDGKNVIGMSLEEVVKKLRGKPGTKVKITVLRKGEKAALEKTLTREIIKVRSVKSAKFKDVIYVKLNVFSEQTFSGMESEIKKMKAQIGDKNLKGLVLDLRNNPGGLLDQSIRVSDAFLGKDKSIVSIKGRNEKDTKEYVDDTEESLIPGLPIVVLINEGSASASEIVSGALQDHKRAIIMGVKSFGKGSVQTVVPLEKNHGAIRLTTALYYTPSGRSIQAKGIEPDIEVTNAKIEKSEKAERDSEADLKGHIEVLKQAIEEAKKEKIGDDNLDVYEQDYQLARAIDLVRGVSIYRSSAK